MNVRGSVYRHCIAKRVKIVGKGKGCGSSVQKMKVRHIAQQRPNTKATDKPKGVRLKDTGKQQKRNCLNLAGALYSSEWPRRGGMNLEIPRKETMGTCIGVIPSPSFPAENQQGIAS